ncbi:DNA repair exonuclease SbcCD ATPase subunit [Pseudomonas silensiensis]|nr:DNA repair exonuclease SbcCD ATPase subunit [Pseudomonas silensiensis]
MQVSISKVFIQNFKIFDKVEVDLGSPNLVVFDGPNGFGKTSFYDAIELLLTGQIRRYKSLSETAIDNRESYKENPYLNIGSKHKELIIKAELLVHDGIICILRKYTDTNLPLDSLSDFKPKLYTADTFQSEIHTLVEDEEPFLENLLGRNYLSNFEFLNYVEQGDSTYILRKKGKERKVAISHLFNTSSFDKQIEILSEASKRIGTLCDRAAQATHKQLQTELNLLKDSVLPEVPYKKLFDISPEWDLENLEFKNGEYVKWLSNSGDISALKELIANKTQFFEFLKNQELNNIIGNENLIKKTLLAYNFLDSHEDLKLQNQKVESLEKTKTAIEAGLIAAIEAGYLNLENALKEVLEDSIDVSQYQSSLESVKSLISTTDNLSGVLNKLKEARETLIGQFQSYEVATTPSDECPLCGHKWGTSDELHQQIEAQSKGIEAILTQANDKLTIELALFTKDQLPAVTTAINDYIINNKPNLNLLTELNNSTFTATDLRNNLTSILKYIPEAHNYLNSTPTIEYVDRVSEIVDRLKLLLIPTDQLSITSTHHNVFVTILKEDTSKLDELDDGLLTEKISYIEWKNSLYQSTTYQAKKIEVENSSEILAKSKKLKDKIDTVKKTYENSLKEYQTDIIQNIEILFHIYSARIVQDTQGGLGLFINADKDGIRFLDDPKKQYDAAFSMSSGQLSALVISFTLALHKRYSHNKLLLIDDPIQTMDDLNVAGLIDLLRQEFSDRQIFIATHEHMMSAYMRYKFQKHGLQTKQVNFKIANI